MERIMIDHPRLRVHVKTGSEGPRHDPYAFTETTVVAMGHVVKLHDGLGTWLSLDGDKLDPPKELNWEQKEAWCRNKAFPALTGYTIEALERLERRIKSRCRKCGNREFITESGYPGETFEVCTKCHHINDCFFNESAII